MEYVGVDPYSAERQQVMDPTLLALYAAAGLVPPVGAFVFRGKRRSTFRKLVRAPRPWQEITLREWVERGWLNPELLDTLPATLSTAQVFYHWAWADEGALRCWRLREPLQEDLPFEASVRDAWSNLPPEVQSNSRAVLSEAVKTAGEWWGGVNKGWNGRPLALLAKDLPRRHRKLPPLPLLPLDDLTAAPLPSAFNLPRVGDQAEGPDLVLILAALKGMTPRFRHPLAPSATSNASLIAGLGTQVGTDVGGRIGAGLGAALGPIGALVGRHIGSAVGKLGGKALADQTLPDEVSSALKETERALGRLGKLTREQDMERAVNLVEKGILRHGQLTEAARQDRARRPAEWFVRSQAQGLLEEVIRLAADELRVHRDAAVHFALVARKAPEPVAGGMILQNPWLVLALPEGVERLNEARRSLNDAAMALRRMERINER